MDQLCPEQAGVQGESFLPSTFHPSALTPPIYPLCFISLLYETLTSNWIPAWITAYMLLYRRHLWIRTLETRQKESETNKRSHWTTCTLWLLVNHLKHSHEKRSARRQRHINATIKQSQSGSLFCFGAKCHLNSCRFACSQVELRVLTHKAEAEAGVRRLVWWWWEKSFLI